MIAIYETHLQILTTPAIFVLTASVTLPVRSVSQDRSLPTVMASAYEWAVPAKSQLRFRSQRSGYLKITVPATLAFSEAAQLGGPSYFTAIC
jgi:hypothetical protein